MLTPKEKFLFFREITLEKNLFTPVQSFSRKLRYGSAEFIRSVWEEILKNEIVRKNLSLYFHIPFCKDRRCTYCMYFSKITHKLELPDAYLKYLLDEFKYFFHGLENVPIRSLYVGGGTPSLMTNNQLRSFFNTVNSSVLLDKKAEISVEQSFKTTGREKIKILREAGVNRLSFGVQSLEENVLANVNREPVQISNIHDILGLAKKMGFRELNIDLMIGLPGETDRGIANAVSELIQAGTDTITIYIFRHLSVHMSENRSTRRQDMLKYNQEYIPKILNLIRDKMRQYGWKDTVQDDRTEYQFFTTENHLNNYDLKGYRTQPDLKVGNSLIGLGHTAFSFAQDFFRYENRNTNYKFEADNNSYVFDMISGEDRRRIFTLDSFFNVGYVDLREFRALFGQEFMDCFSDEIREINSLSSCKCNEDRFYLPSKDRLEHAAYCKFFWNPKYWEGLIK